MIDGADFGTILDFERRNSPFARRNYQNLVGARAREITLMLWVPASAGEASPIQRAQHSLRRVAGRNGTGVPQCRARKALLHACELRMQSLGLGDRTG